MYYVPPDQNREVGVEKSMAEEEQLYDMLVPPGVPRKMIYDVVEKYDVEVVRRPQKLSFANMDGDIRELLAFRGKREVVEEVQKYLLARLKEFVAE
jgi:hypothetical protein